MKEEKSNSKLYFLGEKLMTYLGNISQPCCIIEPIINQAAFRVRQAFCNSTGSGLVG